MVTYYRLLNLAKKMNSTPSSKDQTKIKPLSVLLSSSFTEMRNMQNSANLPQLIDSERTLAIQNTLNAQAEEIKNLRQENLLLQQLNQEVQDKINSKDDSSNLLNSFASKTNTFLQRFDEFLDSFKEQEEIKISQISQTIDNYKFNLLHIKDSKKNFSNSPNLQSKQNQILQLQKEIIDLRSKNSEIEKSNNELQNLLQQIENENNANNNLIVELKNHISEKDQLIATLQYQIQEKDEKINSFNSSKNSQYDDSESFNFTAHDSNVLLADTQHTIESLNTKIDQLQVSLSDKDSLIENLNHMLTESQKEKSSLISQVTTLKANSIENRSTNLLQKQIDQISAENKIKEEEINSLKHQLAISTSTYREDQIKSLSNNIVLLADENSKLKEDIEKVQDSNKKYFDQIKHLQESKSLLNDTNLDLNARIDELEAKLSQIESQKTVTDESSLLNEINELKQLREKDDLKIKSLIKQVQETLDRSEKVKNELISVQEENAKLQNKTDFSERRLKSIQFEYSMLENKIKKSDEIIGQKETTIQQLTASKSELNEQYEVLVSNHITLQRQFEQSNKRFATILGCRPDMQEISKQLTSSIEKLADLQSSFVQNGDFKKENEFLRMKNRDLKNQLLKKEELIRAANEKISLCRDGKESEVVKKFSQDFNELNAEHSNLIDEHNRLQNKMFEFEASYKEIESKLIDQQKINEELLKKSEKIELFEFVTSNFIDFLSSLSSSLISPMIHASPLHKKRLDAVDSLQIQLKKKNFSSDLSIGPWNNFCSTVHELFTFDPQESIQSSVDRIEYVIKGKLDLMCKSVVSNQKKIDLLVNKTVQLKNSKAFKLKPRLSLYERSLRSPSNAARTPTAGRSKLSLNSPLTHSNPLARDNPQNSFEPLI